MFLFNKLKKKEPFVEEKIYSLDEIQNAKIIVLGDCSQKSLETFENAKIAVSELGLSDSVINIGDNKIVVQFGVMQTPALVIDGKVSAYGELLSIEEIKELIKIKRNIKN